MNVKQESYTVQPHWMISDYHLKGTELDVYCLIWGFTQDEQGCYYGSIRYIADYYEISTRTVERTLAALEEKGLLRKWQEVVNGVSVNRYTALRPEVETADKDPRHSVTPDKMSPVTTCREDPRQVVGQTPDNLSPKKEKEKANNNTPRAGAREEPDGLTVAEVFDEFSRGGPGGLYDALMDFDQHRRELAKKDKKKLWTPLVAKKICTSIKRLVDEAGVQDRTGYAIAMLNQSIENGWTGVFAVKDFVDKAPAIHTAQPAPDKPRKITKDMTLADLLGGCECMSASKITTAQQHQLAVIGAAILDPAACKATVERLTPAMFEDGPYRQLFGAIKLRLDSGYNVDAVILEKMLGAGFRPLILMAVETVPTVSHVQDYEALVLEDYRKRLLVELANSVTMSAADADSICRDMGEALKVQDHLRRESVDANVKDFSEVWDETMQWLQKPDTSVKMAWRELDELGLFGEKMVTVLAGRPGHGKTDLALALALRLSNSAQTYYLTMEEDRRKLMMRTMSKLTRINSTRLRDRRITEEERESLNNAFALIKGHTGMIYDDGTRMTVDDIRARVMKYRPRIVFIDHIGLIADTQPGRKEYERLADVTRQLKELAMETGITIVELVQLNRSTDRNGGAKKAALGDLRGSGTIEQDADAVVFIESEVTGERRLQGPNDYFEVSLRVSKNREGETGRVPMWWQPQYHEWQPAPDPSENYNEDDFTPADHEDGPAGW